MSQYEKQAWFNLAVVMLAATVFLVCVPLVGLPQALGTLTLVAVAGLRPYFLNEKARQEVVPDERDREIQTRAATVTYNALLAVLMVGAMGLWIAYKPQGVMPTAFLPLFPALGYMVVLFVQSASTLAQYRRGR